MTQHPPAPPAKLPPGSEQLLADARRLAAAPPARVRIHSYTCDFVRGTNRDTCSCGDAA